jgi:hypothetical protein
MSIPPLFFNFRDINRPTSMRWRASSSAGKKPSSTYQGSWAAINRSALMIRVDPYEGWAMNAYPTRIASYYPTLGKCSVEKSANLAYGFLGERGVKSWILPNELTSGVDPLTPANMLVFGDDAHVSTMTPAFFYTSISSKNLFRGRN